MKSEYLERADRIATDNISSAQQVLKDTLDLLLDFCERNSGEAGFVAELNSIAATLSGAQAQMSALSNICRLITSASARLAAAEMGKYIGVLRQKVGDASARTAAKAAGLVKAGRTYATLSQSEFVLKTFEKAADEGRFATVYVMESRPLFEGRQSARALRAMGHRSILVSDASIGFFVERIEAAFVGADAILSDGTLINKIGSAALAAACTVSKKEFHAITSVLKYDPAKTAVNFLNKEESPHEIFPNPEFEVMNVYFDKVRPDLVTSVVTETGSISPVSGLAALEASMKELYG